MTTTHHDGDVAIDVRDLRQSYGDFEAVRGISFTVAPGELFALLGTNGAGKTTTIETLEGFRRPTGGSVRVFGTDPFGQPAALRPRVNAVLQHSGVFEELTVAETIDLARDLAADPLDRAAVLTTVNLSDKAGVTVRKLSGGERRRLDLGLAILTRPEVLFLDEPTTGMDPEMRRETWKIISDQVAAGVAVVLTTHYLEEADAHAERILVIDGGRIVADDTAEELKRRHVGHRVRLTFEDADQARKAEGAAGELTGTRDIRVYGNRVDFRADRGDETVPELLRSLDAVDVRTRALTLQPPTLDDVFLELTGRSLREGGQRPGPVEP